MPILTEAEAKTLIDKIIAYSKADEISVTLTGGRRGNIRYARNTVTTNGETDDLSVAVTSVFGKRSGAATANELDDAALERMVRRSEEIARLVPENPELMPALGAQQYRPGIAFSENTASLDPAARVDAALSSIEACIRANTTAAGFLQDAASFTAIGNSRGLFGYNKATSGAFTVTARTADERGSGYGVQYFTDAAGLDAKEATERAVAKAIASREAVELKPGKYTVVLEPQAAFDLLSLLMGSLDARSADEGRSFFGKKGSGNRIGEKLFNERVNIYTDPFSAENPASPFASDGRPQQKIGWVEGGVLRNLVYSRYWASQKGLADAPASAENFSMQGTGQSLDDLIRGTERGILVTRFYYIRAVDPQTLVFTGLTRDGTFLIEDGVVKNAVKNFRFNESPANMLVNLQALGSAVRIENSMVPSMRIGNFNFTSLSDAV